MRVEDLLMAKISLDMTEDIRPAEDLQAKAEELLRQVQETRRPIVLTQEGKGAAVLVDVDSHQSLLEDLALLQDVQRGLADVEAGRVVSHEEARAHLMARYGA